MGGAVVRKEPATTALLEHYPAAYQIFEQAGWLNYFRRLQGYNERTSTTVRPKSSGEPFCRRRHPNLCDRARYIRGFRPPH
jgi:hypothetical protein